MVSAFLDEVAAWARARDDVRGVLLVGPQARVDAPADELSDVDLALFVDEPQQYLGEDGWLRSFGEPLLTFVERTPVGGFEERRVLFRDGLEVDFSILPAAAVDAIPPDVGAVLTRGFSVVYDEFGLAGLEPPDSTPPPPPGQADFEQLSNDFWLATGSRRRCVRPLRSTTPQTLPGRCGRRASSSASWSMRSRSGSASSSPSPEKKSSAASTPCWPTRASA